MFDIIRKSFLASLGAAIITKEKIDEATKSLVERGKISKEEADNLAQELIRSGEKQWEELQVQLRDSVGNVMEGLDIPKNSDFEALNARLTALEKRL